MENPYLKLLEQMDNGEPIESLQNDLVLAEEKDAVSMMEETVFMKMVEMLFKHLKPILMHMVAPVGETETLLIFMYILKGSERPEFPNSINRAFGVQSDVRFTDIPPESKFITEPQYFLEKISSGYAVYPYFFAHSDGTTLFNKRDEFFQFIDII
jgi:hypothetical protein